ncbi:hypothetical protein V8E55_006690 [Tylopilus felleus]
MPLLLEFNTQSVRPWNHPQLDTSATLNFNPPFAAPPLVPHGLNELDIANSGNIRVNSTLEQITNSTADIHVITWADSTLYSAIVDVLALAPGDMEYSTGEHIRNLYSNPNDPASVRVDFERSFSTVPKVVPFLNFIDLDKNHNWRLYTNVSDIDADGFTLNIGTWGDTVLYAAQAAWIAYPSDRDDIFSTSVNTQDVHPWNKPQVNTSADISFDSITFHETPSVFVALNSIDINSNANLRIKTYVDDVDTTGLTWHIDTWYNTTLYSAGTSIIAFD